MSFYPSLATAAQFHRLKSGGATDERACTEVGLPQRTLARWRAGECTELEAAWLRAAVPEAHHLASEPLPTDAEGGRWKWEYDILRRRIEIGDWNWSIWKAYQDAAERYEREVARIDASPSAMVERAVDVARKLPESLLVAFAAEWERRHRLIMLVETEAVDSWRELPLDEARAYHSRLSETWRTLGTQLDELADVIEMRTVRDGNT